MIQHLDLHELRDRARAAFVGMAIGDALGATVEFMTAPEISAQYGVFNEIVGGGWLRLKPGQVTDDTEMALCIARAVEKTRAGRRRRLPKSSRAGSDRVRWTAVIPVARGFVRTYCRAVWRHPTTIGMAVTAP